MLNVKRIRKTKAAIGLVLMVGLVGSFGGSAGTGDDAVLFFVTWGRTT